MVGLHSVQTLILQLIGSQFGQQSDASSLLRQIDHCTGTFVPDHGHGHSQLITAVTAERIKDISGEAAGVHADQRRFNRMQVAPDKGQRFL